MTKCVYFLATFVGLLAVAVLTVGLVAAAHAVGVSVSLAVIAAAPGLVSFLTTGFVLAVAGTCLIWSLAAASALTWGRGRA